MKRKQVLGCMLFILLLSAVIVFAGCGGDDDESSDGDEVNGGEPLVCDDDLSDGGFGGMTKAGCDTVQGACENAVTVGNNEWYPCTDDPDCCCYDEPFDGVDDVYPCQYDSCTQDGYCDENCGDVEDPDCD